MSRPAEAIELVGAIAAFIQTSKVDENDEDDATRFDALALRLFAYQYAYNAPYRRFCEGRRATPDTVTSWRDVPAVPAAAFKRFALTCAPEEACTSERGGRIFRSSGTTQAETSRHFMDEYALDLYRISLRAGYERAIPWTAGILAIMPPPAEAPHSSLSFMLQELESAFFWEVDFHYRLARYLSTPKKAPYTIFGTAFAFVNFFDSINERFQLLENCVIVETGGLKGRSREVSRDELYRLFTDRLGVPPERCISEYGMSEMASQFYDSTAIDFENGVRRPTRKVAPPWLKTRTLDPVTGTEAALGQPGLLAHYDLANLNSAFALQTEDMGIAAADGDGFELLGRAPGAVLRGCSLLAEG